MGRGGRFEVRFGFGFIWAVGFASLKPDMSQRKVARFVVVEKRPKKVVVERIWKK